MTNLLEDIKQWIMPTPQWLLTPLAEAKLQAINELAPIKNAYNEAVTNTNRAYANILPNTLTPLVMGVVVVGVIAILLLLKK
jgi:hypothetical protein